MKVERRFVIALLLLATTVAGPSARSGGPARVERLVAVDTPEGITLFVTDGTSPAIFTATGIPAQAAQRTPISSLRPLLVDSALRTPSGIAVAPGGRLVVCDPGVPGVFTVDLSSRALTRLSQFDGLQRPTDVAVSSYGDIAVADRSSGRVLSVSAGGEPQQVAAMPDLEPARLAFVGSDLQVLDGRTGRIKRVTRGRPVDQPSRLFVLPADAPGMPSKVVDFDVHRGVYYLAADGSVAATAARSQVVLPLGSNVTGGISAERVATSAEVLVIAGGGSASDAMIWSLPRPVPAVVALEADARTSSANLVELYTYLLSNKILPTTTYTVPASGATLEQVLLERKVIFAPVSGRTKGAEKSAPPGTQAGVSRLMCGLNAPLCDARRQADLARVIPAGTQLRLPNVPVEEVVRTESVNLDGKSVNDHLDDRVSEEQRKQINQGYLAKINASAARTLEDEFNRLSFTLASPPNPALAPLAFVALKHGGEVAIPELARDCGVQVPLSKVPAYLPELLETRAVGEYLPAPPTGSKGGPSFDRMQVQFEGVVIERVGFRELKAQLSADKVIDCIGERVPPDARIVVEAMRVQRAKYRLWRGNAAVKPNDGELRRLGLANRADPSGTWSLILEGPLYVAYQPASWSEIRKTSQYNMSQVALDPRAAKPGSQQDLFERKTGTVTLPVTRWKLQVLLPASQLASPDSPLRQMESRLDRFHVLSTQDLGAKSQAIAARREGGVDALPQDLEALKATLAEARQKLLKAIRYEDELGLPVVETIGIGEAGRSVDRTHPGFADPSHGSAWLRPVGFGLEPFPVAAANETPEPSLRKFLLEEDHGTHVAGLLAGRSSGHIAGLLPSASLFLIDTFSEAALHESVQDACDRGIFLFNFSFTLPNDLSLRPLRRKLREEWRDRLFIVAAGNQGLDLADGSDAFVAWTAGTDNIIGVGATDTNGDNVLGQWQDDEGQNKDGSNFGKAFVQLVAPGQKIYSLSRGNGYSHATGTSQAVPQVTAVASMLFAAGVTEPGRIKGRLIYAADWLPQFEGKVWGGRLNAKRAAWQPNRNVLWTQSDRQTARAIRVRGNPTVRIVSASSDEPSGPPTTPPRNIPFGNILRLSLGDDNQYRVWYLENGRLKSLKDVVVSGRLDCADMEVWDKDQMLFSRTPASAQECTAGIELTQVFDYVAKAPPAVHF